jgi:hypothetical protein
MKIDSLLVIALCQIRWSKKEHRIDLEIHIDFETTMPLDASHRPQIVDAKVIVEVALVPRRGAEPSIGRYLLAHAAIESPLVQVFEIA